MLYIVILLSCYFLGWFGVNTVTGFFFFSYQSITLFNYYLNVVFTPALNEYWFLIGPTVYESKRFGIYLDRNSIQTGKRIIRNDNGNGSRVK